MSIFTGLKASKKRGGKRISEVRGEAFRRGVAAAGVLRITLIPEPNGLLKDGEALRSDWARVGKDMHRAVRLFEAQHKSELEEAKQESLFDKNSYKAK